MSHSDMYLTDAQHLHMLRVVRDRIAEGVPLDYYDDTTPGDKSMACNWGQCTDHGHTKSMLRRGTPKYREKHHRCPLDQVNQEEKKHSGCFWRCLVFQRPGNLPSKEQALELYDIELGRLGGESREASASM
ncbi:hypothetical protein [Singulisphaera sp. PoT]|uniref:hypothetical protein n=1 Tax=Singulisphaera sp. PoT TaxID=3411797 RepID=UPI003BF54B1A